MPDTGSVDDESLRNAAAEALGLLYELSPDIDVFNLTDAQIHDVMPVPNTRSLNVPKITGTQKFIISSKRCFSSIVYDLWAGLCASRHIGRGERPFPYKKADFIEKSHTRMEILPQLSIQMLESFDLYVFLREILQQKNHT